MIINRGGRMSPRVSQAPTERISTIRPSTLSKRSSSSSNSTKGSKDATKRSTSRPQGAATVKHTHLARTSWFSNLVPRLLQLHPSQVVVFGACFYAFWCVLFAGLYYAVGAECYSSDEDFNYKECLWLSIHTFSTVGYGSIYPTCVAGQLLVGVECYVALVGTPRIAARTL